MLRELDVIEGDWAALSWREHAGDNVSILLASKTFKSAYRLPPGDYAFCASVTRIASQEELPIAHVDPPVEFPANLLEMCDVTEA